MKRPIEKLAGKTSLVKEQASKSLGLQPLLNAKHRVKTDDVQTAIRERLAAEILSYEKKNHFIALLLWLFTGFFGVHRYYLQRIGTGVAMALTGGGFLIWWVIDGFRLKKLVNQFNREQERRQREGLLPIGFGFLPSTQVQLTIEKPAWFKQNRSKTQATVAYLLDLFLLVLLGKVLVTLSLSMGLPQPLLSAVLIILVILLFDQMLPYFHVPFIHELLHLEFKMRLFYTYNKPGSFFKLLLRPIFGLFAAGFNPRARYEVKLYLEFSGVFALFILAFKLIYWLTIGGDPLSLSALIEEFVQVFFVTYAVTGPIGAVMTKHSLIGTHRLKIAAMGLATLFFMAHQSLGSF